MDESGVMQVASATAIFNETVNQEEKKEGIAGMDESIPAVFPVCFGYP